MATKTTLTWEQFLAAGKPDERWEYVDGEVRFMSPTGGKHALEISQIAVVAAAFSAANPVWVSLATDAAFTLNVKASCPLKSWLPVYVNVPCAVSSCSVPDEGCATVAKPSVVCGSEAAWT